MQLSWKLNLKIHSSKQLQSRKQIKKFSNATEIHAEKVSIRGKGNLLFQLPVWRMPSPKIATDWTSDSSSPTERPLQLILGDRPFHTGRSSSSDTLAHMCSIFQRVGTLGLHWDAIRGYTALHKWPPSLFTCALWGSPRFHASTVGLPKVLGDWKFENYWYRTSKVIASSLNCTQKWIWNSGKLVKHLDQVSSLVTATTYTATFYSSWNFQMVTNE